MPVASGCASVAAATYASQMSGSGIGTSSPPGIVPVGEYGYADW